MQYPKNHIDTKLSDTNILDIFNRCKNNEQSFNAYRTRQIIVAQIKCNLKYA